MRLSAAHQNSFLIRMNHSSHMHHSSSSHSIIPRHAVAISTWYITNNISRPVTSFGSIVPIKIARATFMIGGYVAAMVEVVATRLVWEKAFILYKVSTPACDTRGA